MASNKNQHFVPRCYLRSFTINSAGVAINVYNIDREKFIPMAPVKNQCSGSYFYGTDALLEEAIQSVESGYAAALRRIFSHDYRLTDEDSSILKLFCLFQYLRTEAASRRSVEMADAMSDVIGAEGDDFRIQIKEAVQIAMSVFADRMEIVSDLRVRLLKNKTDFNFITSDDPAVLTNRWYLQDSRVRGASFGVGSSGVIMILPLSPRVSCLVFDGDVYSVPHTGGWVDVRRKADVIALNEHQFLNCRANIFLKDSADADAVHKHFLRSRAFRPAVRHRINYAVRDRVEGDIVRYRVVEPSAETRQEDAIIHSQTIYPIPQSWPSILSWRQKGVVYTNGTGAGYLRAAHVDVFANPPFIRERAR